MVSNIADRFDDIDLAVAGPLSQRNSGIYANLTEEDTPVPAMNVRGARPSSISYAWNWEAAIGPRTEECGVYG